LNWNCEEEEVVGVIRVVVEHEPLHEPELDKTSTVDLGLDVGLELESCLCI
jgi:hypothetical protein